MTISATPSIRDGSLIMRGRMVLTGVPGNVTIKPLGFGSAFIGATSETLSSCHVFTLGVLEGCRFLSLFRAKIWWMIPRVGDSADGIPPETQMLLVEARDKSALERGVNCNTNSECTLYVVILPVLDGAFRASLLGNSANELQFCIESGDTNVQTAESLEAVFINSGHNPFELLKESIKILEKQKGTFSCIENKKLPVHLDWFGWCTWDAFYRPVNPEGIKEGLQSLKDGGCSPKFLIIDDGWQDTLDEFHKDGEPFLQGTDSGTPSQEIRRDLHGLIHFVKDKYGVRFVYMWHALAGYWGGVHPSSKKLKKYNPKLVYPIQSDGNISNLRDIAMDSLAKCGVGLIDPRRIHDFYDDLHSYLAKSGADGVKVDVQNILETLGQGYGGRVALTRQYQEALEQSIARNFKENDIICCMCHNTESIYSLLLGEIVVPDWDMFHSKHNTAGFHAAARAVGGCAVYVSDKPGNHDFKILRKLVLPDGSVLRARCAGRPTRDCLFKDPVMDGESLLKIWNLNKLNGIVGAFNCQGAGAWPLKEGGQEKPITAPIRPPISGHVHPLDVEFLEDMAGENWEGDSAVYAFHAGSLRVLSKREAIEARLRTLCCEIYTISPIRVFDRNVSFAPIGLLDMYNSGGAVEELAHRTDPSWCVLNVKVRGCGRFGAYSSSMPKWCKVDAKEEEFTYSTEDKLLTLELPGECRFWDVEVVF
ncbi:hypothetical protein BT93_K0233 [Corymbia citriodora subsp. variegata]|nr:hypothetical protein BT93_K0233 [Corymbia citriodora subsp. variegata]